MESNPPALPPVVRPKRWPGALLVAFITGLIAMVAAFRLADWATDLLNVSNFEGSRSCGVVVIYTPLGVLLGLVVGFTVGLLVKGRGLVGYLKRQIIALLIVAAVLAATAALVYSAADHAPLIDGKPLALQIEVRVPAKARTVKDLEDAGFCAYLFAPAAIRQNTGSTLWNEASATDQFITIPVSAPLNSREERRSITVDMVGVDGQIIDLTLPASPRKIDDSWSEWKPTEGIGHARLAPGDQDYVRYRVVYAPAE